MITYATKAITITANNWGAIRPASGYNIENFISGQRIIPGSKATMPICARVSGSNIDIMGIGQMAVTINDPIILDYTKTTD